MNLACSSPPSTPMSPPKKTYCWKWFAAPSGCSISPPKGRWKTTWGRQPDFRHSSPAIFKSSWDHRDEASTFLNEARALDARYREAVIAARDGYEGIFREVLRTGINSGDFNPHIDPVMATIFILSILNAVGRWYRPDGKLGREDLAHEMWEFISSGLTRPGNTSPPAAGLQT